MREDFEKWVSYDMAGVPLERSSKYGTYLAPCLNRMLRTWQARQAEIDALKVELAYMKSESEHAALVDEIEQLKAENERLRNAAKPVIDYWFEDNDRTHDDDNKAFLELSNAYYRRENKYRKDDVAMKETK